MSSSQITTWISDAASLLAETSPSARLDAELILASTLGKSRTWLHANGECDIPARFLDIANARLSLRQDDVPIAYILGYKEFYGRNFIVTPATLIPRPESEAVIVLLQEAITHNPTAKQLVDVGTGSGCLGITAKLEHPQLSVTLTDTSKPALNVAEKNAAKLNAQVVALQSNLLEKYPLWADIIIANLPYVDESWDVSSSTKHEPHVALFAKKNGLELINKLIDQTQAKLAKHGALILEADPRQHHDIIETCKKAQLTHSKTVDFCLLFTKS